MFEDTLKDGWLVINAVTTYVVQMDGGKFTSLGDTQPSFQLTETKKCIKLTLRTGWRKTFLIDHTQSRHSADAFDLVIMNLGYSKP